MSCYGLWIPTFMTKIRGPHNEGVLEADNNVECLYHLMSRPHVPIRLAQMTRVEGVVSRM